MIKEALQYVVGLSETKITEIDGKKYVKGFGEIRIIDLKKKIRYAAPNVIIDDILS